MMLKSNEKVPPSTIDLLVPIRSVTIIFPGRESFFLSGPLHFFPGREVFSRQGPCRESKKFPAVKLFPMPGPDREFHLPDRVPVETIFSRFFPAGTRQKSRQKVPDKEFRTLALNFFLFQVSKMSCIF